MLIFVMVVLTACGGGRATTTATDSTATSPSSNPSGSSEPAGSSEPLGSAMGSVTLSWQPPTTYTDGTAITVLGGHNIYVNNGSGYSKLVTINNVGIVEYVVEDLVPGSYTFVVTAFDSEGVESAYSDGASITIGS